MKNIDSTMFTLDAPANIIYFPHKNRILKIDLPQKKTTKFKTFRSKTISAVKYYHSDMYVITRY